MANLVVCFSVVLYDLTVKSLFLQNSTKDKLDSPSSVSCAGEEGKLLLKGLLSLIRLFECWCV